MDIIQDSKNNITYNAHHHFIFDECDIVVITNSDNKILQILDCDNLGLIANSFECNIHNTKHNLSDNINLKDCWSKWEIKHKTFTEKKDLIKFLSKVGNRAEWAGHSLRLDSDEDGELFGVYKDGNKIFAGWVATHQNVHLPRPRIIELTRKNKNGDEGDEEKIDVVLDDDPDTGTTMITYDKHIAYAFPNVYEEIENRIKYLLHSN